MKITELNDEILNEILVKYQYEMNTPEMRECIKNDIIKLINEKLTDDTTAKEIDNGSVAFINENNIRFTIGYKTF